MVRTVHKSGKSTGGPAKRSVLPGPFKRVSGLRGEQVVKVYIIRHCHMGGDIDKKDILSPQFWNHRCLFCRDGAPQMHECSHCPRQLSEAIGLNEDTVKAQ